MDYYAEYKRKLKTPDEAVLLIRAATGWIGMNHNMPELLDEALSKRVGELGRGQRALSSLI